MNRHGLLLGFAIGLALSAAGMAAGDDIPDLGSDTWAATDALGRSLPTAKEVGPPRPGKTVVMFYFLWLGQSGDLGPFDISRILVQDPAAMSKPTSPPWGPMLAPHHWGESIFGHYVSEDEAVLRKHAQMLANAGVDAVFFDVTNQVTYPASWKALCRVFDRARKDGVPAPKIGFLCPFGDPGKVVRELWHDLYEPGQYRDLWFEWEGRPLILADPALLGRHVQKGRNGRPDEVRQGQTHSQAFTAESPFDAVGACTPTWGDRGAGVTLTLYRAGRAGGPIASRRFEGLEDNAWSMIELDKPLPSGAYELTLSEPKGRVGWWAGGGSRTLRIRPHDEATARILKSFTFRKPQPDYFVGPTGPRQWSWLEVYPQHAFYAKEGVPEQVAVGVAENAVDGKLGVLSNPRSHGRSFHDGEEPGPEGRDGSGKNFAEQWKRAFEIDPAVVFVTGWNEWIAGRFDQTFPLAGSGPVTFCDEFDQEFSRDIEPMRGGHGDNYYYQLVANVRRFKGVREATPVASRPIAIDGRFDDWAEVKPDFRDAVGDPMHRDHAGWGKAPHYRNDTGRNDIASARVSVDPGGVSFYARAREDLSPPSDSRWMLLFVDADNDPRTGWLGYDLRVNARRTGDGKATVERNVDGAYRWETAGEAPFARGAREVELTLPPSTPGLARPPASLDFKWADNIQETGDWSDFTLNGDAAPDDRFNFRAVFPAAGR
ncbi:hypothetical protein OJF2_44710 [Aquisphaera giovannonii]|uniref:Uncharacterized protein n=1 Tax=Aquisphaera giovannonii TaxID=406548 RepID=A0A5B9W6Q9_9BACT|nr:hypothetical protein [Aquisphaera giovannonii]QEH35914.1 hypothetical protein OJF2_44710 [Aquisphaera giovannonii]